MTFVAKRLAVTDVLHSNEPEGVFYTFTRYDVDLPSTEVVRLFLQDSVAVRSGTEFGRAGQRRIRLSFTVPWAGSTRASLVLPRRSDGFGPSGPRSHAVTLLVISRGC
ncbi:hypothetical protein [Streptomyces milbemycinicus]|uniref:Uncharacterized protein n=1 Tax=Streptomyces milbemycinicus TaxID=476552 RepID=A0ABW8M0V7_9ACTN